MPDMQHVAVLHNVVLAFQPQLALGSCVGFRSRIQQRVPVNGFRADEMFFQIRVDRSSSILSA